MADVKKPTRPVMPTEPFPVTVNKDPGDAYSFVQFGQVVAVADVRGMESLTDRATAGKPLGDHGAVVESILCDGQWFDIVTAGGKAYRVPSSNVRSARR